MKSLKKLLIEFSELNNSHNLQKVKDLADQIKKHPDYKSEYDIDSLYEQEPGWVLIGADFSSLEDRIAALTTKDPNKLKVYEDGYDGHCLRAYAYFKDQMPDIRQIPENSALKTYCANVNGTDICFTSGDTIKYKNSAYTGEEFYELFTNNRL